MTTVANVKKADSSHWYYTDGRPCYELPKKDGTGNKTPTLADARKLNLLPSVTTILKVLHKEGLVNWMIEQACLAVLTTPRPAEEPIDAFVERVLKTERVQDQEAKVARDRGTEIHDALESLAKGAPVSDEIALWVRPVWDRVLHLGKPIMAEISLVGTGYAGKTDLLIEAEASHLEWIIDYKTTKKLPEKASWDEHRLQLAAYAAARSLENGNTLIKTGNLYISTAEPGKFAFFENPPWPEDYMDGFLPLVKHWQWLKGYRPNQDNKA